MKRTKLSRTRWFEVSVTFQPFLYGNSEKKRRTCSSQNMENQDPGWLMQHNLCRTSKVESNSHKSLHLGIYFTMPGVHSEIGPCKNHAEKFDTWVHHRTIDDWLLTPSNLIICFRTEFCQLWYKNKTSNTKVSIQNVSNHVTTIPVDLKDNNDPFTLHFRFHCYTRFVFVTLVIYCQAHSYHTLVTYQHLAAWARLVILVASSWITFYSSCHLYPRHQKS